MAGVLSEILCPIRSKALGACVRLRSFSSGFQHEADHGYLRHSHHPVSAVVGCLYIFDLMTFDARKRMMLKFGSAIALLGVCAALVKLLMGRMKEQQD